MQGLKVTSKDFSRISRKYPNIKLKLNVSYVESCSNVWDLVSGHIVK